MSRVSAQPAPTPSGDGVELRSPGRGLRSLAVAATCATFLLIAIGAMVRATGSGLGCTGWPRCTEDRWLPPLEHHALIEYTHRMTAFVATVLIVAVAFIAWRRYRAAARVFRPAMAGAALVVFQAVLGGIVVKGDLHALLVTAHFMTAMILAGVLVVATVGTFTLESSGSPGPRDGLARLAWVTAGGLFALLGVGAYVRGEGAGLAFRDWPLMDGRAVPALSHLRPALHFAHRALALAVLVLAITFAVRAWRARAERPQVFVLALVATGLFVAQILVGAANVWSGLAPAAVTAHVAVAGLLWGALVAAATVAGVSPARAPDHGELVPPPRRGSMATAAAGPFQP